MRSVPNPLLVDFNDYTPMNDVQAVTPNDSADLPNGTCRGIIFSSTTGQPNATGNVTFITAMGTQVTIYISSNWFGLQYIRISRILATGTTFNGAIFVTY
jgi:hypothetical protein